ncbi:MAG: phosphoglucosamine mutase [Spirulina sp. DLM2.Bin59]|nr:MAG: phosphoglucosamine mutase [Spirulina sp. DLM2.Bin59]
MVSSPIRPQSRQATPSPGIGRLAQLGLLPQTPLFGTDGIRGKAGELLNASLALEVGYWAGQVLQDQDVPIGPVIIGQDSRNSSDMLATALASGLTSAGLEVWNVGLCPTPCVSYLTRQTHALGGVMISASHNPPEDNGIKFFSHNGTKLGKPAAARIEAGLRGQGETSLNGMAWGKHQHTVTLIRDYADSLQRSLPTADFTGLKIVLDLAWGAAVQLAPELFRLLGAEVIALHDAADGDRINVNCGSTHLQRLQAAVQEYGADLGFAFDGDADRVMAVDNHSRVIDGDYILYLWGQQLMAENQLPDNLLIGTVMANLGFERAWQAQGGQFHRTDVGDQHVQAAMFEFGAALGGEQSGHILCHHHSFSGDGVQTALHLTALVKANGVSLADLRDQSFQTYPQLLQNIRVESRERRQHWQDCEAVQRVIAQGEADLGDRGRILVRASGTEPLIRVMVEAAEADAVEHWTQVLSRAVTDHLA